MLSLPVPSFQPFPYDNRYDVNSMGCSENNNNNKPTTSASTADISNSQTTCLAAHSQPMAPMIDYMDNTDAALSFASPWTLLGCRCPHVDACLPRFVSTSRRGRDHWDGRNLCQPKITTPSPIPTTHLNGIDDKTAAQVNKTKNLSATMNDTSVDDQTSNSSSSRKRNSSTLGNAPGSFGIFEKGESFDYFYLPNTPLNMDESTAIAASVKAEEWLERMRISQDVFWESMLSKTHIGDYRNNGRQLSNGEQNVTKVDDITAGAHATSCRWCIQLHDYHKLQQASKNNKKTTLGKISKCDMFPTEDELMQCLDCGIIACGPSFHGKNCVGQQHLLQHFVATGHFLGITCGQKSELFCMRCGDFIYHEVFESEKLRMEIKHKLPAMGWPEMPIIRSVTQPSQFVLSSNGHEGNGGNSIVWPGMVSTYPISASPLLVDASLVTLKRLHVLSGDLSRSDNWVQGTIDLALHQASREKATQWQIMWPSGLHNLGNTCFMNCALQCLIHCAPLQRYFLRDVGHSHQACELIRKTINGTSIVDAEKKEKHSSCLACEMDRLLLEMFGLSINMDALGVLSETSNYFSSRTHRQRRLFAEKKSLRRMGGEISRFGAFEEDITIDIRKENNAVASSLDAMVDTSPKTKMAFVPSRMLTEAWSCGDMNHLAGYEQKDAQEFLQAFLNNMGKQMKFFSEQIFSLRSQGRSATMSSARRQDDSDDAGEQCADVVPSLFEGRLRSVVICARCGCKRSKPETFLNVSLPIIAESRQSGKADNTDEKTQEQTIARTQKDIQMCLEQFTSSEILTDPVHCPWCNCATPSMKQLTFAKLPKVLILHLKRFDARTNKKICDYVSFPLKGLDMGRHLPYWMEAIGLVKKLETAPTFCFTFVETDNFSHMETLLQSQ